MTSRNDSGEDESIDTPALPPPGPRALIPRADVREGGRSDVEAPARAVPLTLGDVPKGKSVNNAPPESAPESVLSSPAMGVSLASNGVDSSHRKRSTKRDEQFRLRLQQHRQRELVFELMANGRSEMKEMTVREVFQYVQDIVEPYALATASVPARGPAYVQSSYDQQRGPAEAGARVKRNSSITGMSMSSLCLHQRDVRQLFSSQNKSEPAFSVRRNCILINFETLRGIVLVDRLLLVVDPGADSILLEVRKAISETADEVNEFELIATEALLSVSSKRLEKEVRKVEEPVSETVEILEGHGSKATSAENNDKFRKLSNKINELENKAKARRRALLMVLEDDADLAMMNLTRMYQNPEDYVPPLTTEVLEDHEEMELLLEAYLQDINSIYNVLEILQARVRSTEALVMVKLDIARNKILTAGMIFSLVSTCFTLGALVAGIFGMNLESGLEGTNHLFPAVSYGTVGVMVIGFCLGFYYFHHNGILVS